MNPVYFNINLSIIKMEMPSIQFYCNSMQMPPKSFLIRLITIKISNISIYEFVFCIFAMHFNDNKNYNNALQGGILDINLNSFMKFPCNQL